MSASLFHRGYQAPVAKLRTELRECYRAIADQKLREWDNREPVGSLEPAHRAVEAAIRNLERIKDAAEAAMAQLAEQRLLRTQVYRQFKLDHGITRDARIPDILTTILIALVAMLVEGAATAALMVADGKMDIPAAAAYGMSVTILNYATGMFAGYFTARYLDHRADSPTPGPRDHRTRWIARAGFAALVGMLVLLNFGAARVRATGSHSGIFDFETASFGHGPGGKPLARAASDRTGRRGHRQGRLQAALAHRAARRRHGPGQGAAGQPRIRAGDGAGVESAVAVTALIHSKGDER